MDAAIKSRSAPNGFRAGNRCIQTKEGGDALLHQHLLAHGGDLHGADAARRPASQAHPKDPRRRRRIEAAGKAHSKASADLRPQGVRFHLILMPISKQRVCFLAVFARGIGISARMIAYRCAERLTLEKLLRYSYIGLPPAS